MICRLPLHLARCCAVSVAALGLFGCSAHPLPGDFSRKSTFEIVEKIRCEGAEALRGIPAGNGFLKETFIGYDFDFDITEVNDTGTASDPGRLLFERKRPSGTSKLDLRGYATRERKAQRTFRIVESLDQLKTANCSPETKRENLLHPVTGSIGMDEIIRTFVGLERLTTVVQAPSGASPAPDTVDVPGAVFKGIPGPATTTPVVFSDVLIFTTTLGGSAKPSLEITAIAIGSLKLKTAQIFGQATRSDVHKLQSC
jgi:hypothetical protein